MRFLISFLLFFIIGFQVKAQKLVLPGDYPDPSVVKIGDTYWASATTSNWLPAYPLLKSKDLINWETSGNIFIEKPSWVDFYFWAPEITYDNGKVYVYYSAHLKDGNLCVGIASADKPEGPYKDHGPLICEPAGSIDAFPMRDENGKLYLIWKEDGNSVKKPTPVWIQELNEERTALIGEKKELFRNDAPWEANLVEGVSMIKNGDYFYAFYAAAGCCGPGCTYNTGVARAKSLLGPWEKYDKNPILTNDEAWKCPGHGTPVEKDGKYYFLYHAYSTRDDIYVGRQGLLAEFKFTPDGWVEFIKEPETPLEKPENIEDLFNGNSLSSDWQWSVFQNIDAKVKKGRVQLNALPTSTGAFIGQKIIRKDYEATTKIRSGKSTAWAGIAAIGDEENTISALVKDDSVKVVLVKDNKETIVSSLPVRSQNKVNLRIKVKHGKDITFLYSTDGRNYIIINQSPIDGSFLPPWDRAVRVGLISNGETGERAVFDNFNLTY